MKQRDGDSRKVGGGSEGASEYKKKKRLGGKGLSVEAFVGANRIKPIVTASQIRKQREGYQNSKTVNKYRKTLKHLAEEGHEFRPHIPLSIDAEIPGQDISDPRPKSKKEKKHSPSSDPPSAETQTSSGKEEHGKKSEKGRQAKPQSHLERLREDYEKKKQEEEEIRKEKRELFEEQQAAREKSKKERKDVQKKFRKTTGKGQPVMKHRMEHLLESIQRDMKS